VGLGVVVAAGHEMTAAWHVGPMTGWELWRTLVTSPEILVFLFFMITDPRTIPTSSGGRRAYAVAVGFLAALLIAPWTTEFDAKVAVLGALAIVCAARPLLLLVAERARVAPVPRLPRVAVPIGVAGACGALVLAGIPARPAGAGSEQVDATRIPAVSVVASGVAPIDRATARRIARDLVLDLGHAAEALRTRNRARASRGATGARLSELWSRIAA
jgi:hypothetical protein